MDDLRRLRPEDVEFLTVELDREFCPRPGEEFVERILDRLGEVQLNARQGRQLLVERLLDLGELAGLRPGSPDGMPFIGDHPEIRGLYLNTGHFRNGVVMGPASARLLVDHILGRESFTGIEAYLFDREIKK